MTTHNSPKKIGLMGFFGYGNLGDAALQEAMIQHIRAQFPDAQIYGFSLDPEDTEARHGIKSFQISRAEPQDTENGGALSYRLAKWLGSRQSPFLQKLDRWVIRIPIEFRLSKEAFHNLKGFDALLVAGSGPLNDYWGGGGALSFPYTLLKWGIIAKLRRAKFLFISVGAGPINARMSKVFIKYALSLADYRSFRDEYSQQLVRSIGFKGAAPIYPDLAHSLQLQNGACANDDGARPIVGIGPMGYFKGECWPEADASLYQDYLEKMAAFIGWLIQKQYSILFLPGETYFDQLVIGDLVELLQQKQIPAIAEKILRPPILSLEDLVANIAQTSFVVASRFHNVLLSQAIGKPVIALSYQEKIDALMKDTGQAAYCLPIGQFSVEALKAAFSSLETNRQALATQVAEKLETYKLALDEQYQRVFQIL